MNQEYQLIETENRCPIEIEDIIRHTNKFYSIMNVHQNIKNDVDMIDVIKDFQLATLEFSNAKNLLVNLLMPTNNPYIEEAQENHNWLVDDLGRVDKEISEFQGKVGAKIEANIQLKKPNSFVELYRYYNYLIEAMNGLVFYPLVNSVRRFIKMKEKITEDAEKKLNLEETKEKMFLYWVFLEMYQSSLSIGSITRQDIQNRLMKGTTKDKNPVIMTTPSHYPSSVSFKREEETEEKTYDLFGEEYESY